MTRIVVTKRSYDHHACLEGRPEVWGCGVTVESAVRSLVSAHREHFGGPAEVVYKLSDGFFEAMLCRSSRA